VAAEIRGKLFDCQNAGFIDTIITFVSPTSTNMNEFHRIDAVSNKIIDRCANAIKVNRYLYLLLIIASTVIFIGLWNTFKKGWQHQRTIKAKSWVKISELAETCFDDSICLTEYKQFLLMNSKFTNAQALTTLTSNTINDAESIAYALLQKNWITDIDYITIKRPEINKFFIQYLLQYNYITRKESSQFLSAIWNDSYSLNELKSISDVEFEYSVRSLIDNVKLIELPFFGIRVDANDLIILSGVSLTFIMIMILYATSREHKILLITFDAIDGVVSQFKKDLLIEKPEGIESAKNYATILKLRYYQLISNSNVLTISPRIMYNRQSNSPEIQYRPHGTLLTIFFESLPTMTLLLPIILHLSVFIYDWTTYEFAFRLLGKSRFIIQMTVGGIFGIIIILLSIACIRFMNRINKFWKKVSDLDRQNIVVIH